MTALDIVFIASLMLGAIYMLFTLAMGGLTHAAHASGDAMVHSGDAGGDFAHHGGDAASVDHADGGHHGDHHGSHDSDGAASRFHLLAYLNPSLLAGFLIGFGGLGTICRMAFHWGAGASTAVGLVGGISIWYLANQFITRIFAASSASSHTRREEVVGKRAKVTATIEGHHPGMISLVSAGSRQVLRAVTSDEDSIPVGSSVRIRKVEAGTVHVTRLD